MMYGESTNFLDGKADKREEHRPIEMTSLDTNQGTTSLAYFRPGFQKFIYK